MAWYIPKDSAPREQCPCCGYISLAERGMSLICPVCFWEDDAFIGNKLDEYSVCNKITLRQARANFKTIGACDRRSLAHIISLEERAQFTHLPFPSDES
ncbi:MAG: CPCC family cysteine-rich protein [Cyanobacteria bacterium P01_E01_bin.42]